MPNTSSPGSGLEAVRPLRGWIRHLWLVLPFLLLYWLDLYHHQTWFDEVNAWGISAASPNLRTLFHLVHYEGHPWLWYFLLYWPTRLTHNPDQMKWVVGLFGTGIFLVLGLLSPFSRGQKLLLFCSYFVVFEYTVTLRMYGIMFLLALLYAYNRSRRPGAVVVNLALLAAMTNVDMTAAVLSGALLLEYLFSLGRANQLSFRRLARPVLLGLLLYGAALLVSVASLLPAKDISWQTSGHLGATVLQYRPAFLNLADVLAGPWWPISPDFPVRFWETDAHHQHFLFLLAPVVAVAYWQTFRRSRNLSLLMGSTVVLAYLWADVVYAGRVRHWGICFVSFVVALWLQTEQQRAAEPTGRAPGTSPTSASWSPWAYGLLGLNAVAGVLALVSSWTHPFSQATTMAHWIEQHEPAGVLVTGTPDVSFVSVAQQMQRPVYQLECDCIETYKLFSHAHENFDNAEIGSHLDRALEHLHRQEILFLFWKPLDPDIQADLAAHGLQPQLLAHFDHADLLVESFYLYRVSRTPAGTEHPLSGQ